MPMEKRGEICWCQDKIFKGDIEYIRADHSENNIGKELNAARYVDKTLAEIAALRVEQSLSR